MSYGADTVDLYRRAAVYVDKILKGAKPADLPVQQATKFEFVINLKAAKQIGLTLSPEFLRGRIGSLSNFGFSIADFRLGDSDMTKTFRTAILWLRSDNPKSNECAGESG